MANIKKDVKRAFADNRCLILISAIVFLATLFAGYFFTDALYSYLNPNVELLKEGVSSGSIRVDIPTILLNNIFIVFRLFIYGMFFCLSVVLLGYNGLFLGYFIGQSGNFMATVLLIVPHGIFELPSIVIANASGLVLFKYFFNVFSLKNSEPEGDELIVDGSIVGRLSRSAANNGNILRDSLVLLLVSAVLMAIAGFVEVYITKGLALGIINYLGLQ